MTTPITLQIETPNRPWLNSIKLRLETTLIWKLIFLRKSHNIVREKSSWGFLIEHICLQNKGILLVVAGIGWWDVGFGLQKGVEEVARLLRALVLVDSIHYRFLNIMVPHLHVVPFNPLLIPVHFLASKLNNLVWGQIVLTHLTVGTSLGLFCCVGLRRPGFNTRSGGIVTLRVSRSNIPRCFVFDVALRGSPLVKKVLVGFEFVIDVASHA